MWRGQICTQRAPVVSRTRQADVWVRTFGCNLNQFRKTKMNISSENSAKSWQEQGCNWASGNLQAPPGFSLSLCLSAYISHLHLHLPSPSPSPSPISISHPHSIFLPAIISYLLKSDLSLFCFKPSFLWFPLLLGKSSNALTGLPRFPMIWRFSLPLPHSPHQPHREVKESWLRAWTLEIEHLAVVPGSSFGKGTIITPTMGSGRN